MFFNIVDGAIHAILRNFVTTYENIRRIRRQRSHQTRY